MTLICMQNFANVTDTTLARPILFSCYTSKSYQEVEREELRMLVQVGKTASMQGICIRTCMESGALRVNRMLQGKLKVFYEEELNVQLVIFDQVLDHITRIDRVLRQPLGHLLLGR
jgi:dynein heavy chain 1, cytosolic